MNFAGVYRISFYVMLTLATLTLSIDATDQNPIAMLYPVAVAVAGALAFVTVDRNPKLGLDRGTMNMLALASLGLVYLELRFDENLLILAWTHWLVYLQLVMMFLPKTIRDDWHLFVISTLQVVVGGVISQSDMEGAALLSWAISALWVLGLFTLHREAIRARTPEGVSWFPPIDPREPYPKLIDSAFVLSAVRVALTTLALGGVIFLAMPRRPSMGMTTTGDLSGKHLTGFDEDVQLGQLGEILENDSVVMTVSLFDKETDAVVTPREELLFRGVTLSRYTRGRWSRTSGKTGAFVGRLSSYIPPSRVLVQQIRMEPTDNSVLFAIPPVINGRGGLSPRGTQTNISFDANDGSLGRAPSNQNVAYDYRIESLSNLNDPQPGQIYPDPASRAQLSRITDNLLAARLRAITEPVIRSLPPGDILGIARALEAHLRDSGQFHYTLKMDVVDSSLDPVLDFLVNRKEGHCEYFASALTLMLRSVGIPARMVNGFKGGDYNDLSRTWIVRQKHAHSWVEVLLNPPSDSASGARWVSLDPTPGTEREDSISRIGGVPASFRQLSDFVRYVWAFYVIGFNAERQRRFLYDPIRELFRQAQIGYLLLWNGIKKLFTWVFHFPNVAAFFSFRGLVVSFLGLLLLALLIRVGFLLVRLLVRKFRGEHEEDSMLAAGILFYRRMLELLEQVGLERPPSETPREFARRAAIFLCTMDSDSDTVADVPPQVVDAFYRIRFGRHDLTEADLNHLERRLDALEACVRPSRG